MTTHWTLDDIPWAAFDFGRIDPDLLPVVKAAALVERNGGDYQAYLCGVFHDDPVFQATARRWAAEEIQHGEALGRWAEMADAGFSMADAFGRFIAGYRLPVDARLSVRGSRTGELVARCVVEVGTSSFYSALRDATDEPVLKEICRRVAADEFRHYKTFYDAMHRYREREGIGLWRRLAVALGRLRESDDDELAFAWHCANEPEEAYERRRCNAAYGRRAYALYRREHVERAVAMTLKAVGLPPRGRLARWAGAVLWSRLRRRAAA